MDLDLTGKRAIVCGSTQGIGLAAAKELAHMGAHVTLVARNADKLQRALEQLEMSGNQSHHFMVADFTQPEQLRNAIQADLNANGTAHILVNNTGGPPAGLAIDADINAYLAAFNQHLICNQILAQALTPGMKEAKFGRIINVISTSVKAPLHGLGVSNTVRGAVANWAKTLANELGMHNITVNNVLPGATNTVRLESIIANKAKKTGQTEEVVAKAMADAVPMKRVAEAHEVGNAIAFLASPAASYINGINVPVDGGRTPTL